MTYDQNVQLKINRIYDLMPAASRAQIISMFISGAEVFVENYTGLASGNSLYDELVEDTAALSCISWAAGGTSSGFSYSLGTLSVNKGGSNEYAETAELISRRIENNIKSAGKKIRYSKVND